MNLRYHFSGLLRWCGIARRHGRPDALFHFQGGIGDQLLCSAVAREFQSRRPRNLWFLTQTPELFSENPDFTAVLPVDLALIPWSRLSGARVQQLYYQAHLNGAGRDAPLHEPSIASLCRRAGLEGEVVLRPYLPQIKLAPLAPRERPRIAIHSSCLSARFPIANKQWPLENLNEVAAQLSRFADLVQFGSLQDPLLPGVRDLRGGGLISVAQTLSQCDLFVGLVGFLMHLARAVECPAVIVYGGREPPEITGYACNDNLAERPPCAPCWYYTHCDFERRCLSAISPETVVGTVLTRLKNGPSRPLLADSFVIKSA